MYRAWEGGGWSIGMFVGSYTYHLFLVSKVNLASCPSKQARFKSIVVSDAKFIDSGVVFIGGPSYSVVAVVVVVEPMPVFFGRR